MAAVHFPAPLLNRIGNGAGKWTATAPEERPKDSNDNVASWFEDTVAWVAHAGGAGEEAYAL